MKNKLKYFYNQNPGSLVTTGLWTNGGKKNAHKTEYTHHAEQDPNRLISYTDVPDSCCGPFTCVSVTTEDIKGVVHTTNIYLSYGTRLSIPESLESLVKQEAK